MAEKLLKKVPRFNDHGSACHGHQNWMLDCEFERQSERDVLARAIDNYLRKKDATDTAKAS